MELFDYVAFRWKTWLALLVVGVIIIVAVGMNAGESGYQARAQLLVRPSVSQATTYASDPDRFVETEMALLRTPANLLAAAEETRLSADELADSLSYTHQPESEIVNLVLTADNADQAVNGVNAVADAYIAEAARSGGAGATQTQAVQNQIDTTTEQLRRTNSRIQRAIDNFTAANPDAPSPSTSRVAPEAAVQATLLTNRLQQLSSQQTELRIANATSGARSEVLDPAEDATSAQGWSTTTFLAAIVGWVLLLLAAAAVGLALTSRLLGPARWSQVTQGSGLGVAIRLRGRTKKQRAQTVRRVLAALRADGTPDAAFSVVHAPEQTPALERRAGFLLDALREEGITVHDRKSAAEPVLATSDARNTDPASGSGHHARSLLLVDLSQTRLDDVRALTQHPDAFSGRIVSVLV